MIPEKQNLLPVLNHVITGEVLIISPAPDAGLPGTTGDDVNKKSIRKVREKIDYKVSVNIT